MKGLHRAGDTVGHRVLLAVEHCGNHDGNHCHYYAGACHAHVKMGDEFLAVVGDEAAEWNEACHTRDYRKNNQRKGHYPLAVVRCVVAVVWFVPPEDAVVKTEHVECCQTCHCRHPHSPERAVLISSDKNLILTEEACKRRYTCDSETCDKECDVGYRHILAEVAHGVHLVAVHHVDNGAGAKEEQALEHCVCKQVEH